MEFKAYEDIYKVPFSFRNWDNLGLVNVLWPDLKVYDGMVSPFITSRTFIFIEHKKVKFPENYNVIRLTKGSTVNIDDRVTFMALMCLTRGFCLSEKDREILMSLDDDAFWIRAKILLVVKNLKVLTAISDYSIFDLFCELFSSFKVKYAIYRKLTLPHQVIFSSLLTMMIRTIDVDSEVGISAGYKRVLLKNKPYIGKFKKAVVSYIDSDKTEMDFIQFLNELSLA